MANGPNIFQMLLVSIFVIFSLWTTTLINLNMNLKGKEGKFVEMANLCRSGECRSVDCGTELSHCWGVTQGARLSHRPHTDRAVSAAATQHHNSQRL